jgi:UDP-N-acetylglucosamine acyltransferase
MVKKGIHPLAVVEEGAKIGNNVTIEPFVVIKGTVTLHDDVVIKSHAYIDGYTTIGAGTTVYPSASIGTKAQDLKFRGERTYVKIGKNCEIRESVTINSSSQQNSVVEIGDNCMIMAYSHIAHNCVLGNNVIMSNNATLAGHVTIDDYAIIGGLTPVHQYVRIGAYAMVGGLSRVTHDILPYTIGAGIPFKFGGLNLVGLKRHGFSLEVRRELSKAFRLLYRSKLHLEEALSQMEKTLVLHPEIQYWIRFIKETQRGIMGLQGVIQDGEVLDEMLEENESNRAVPV